MIRILDLTDQKKINMLRISDVTATRKWGQHLPDCQKYKIVKMLLFLTRRRGSACSGISTNILRVHDVKEAKEVIKLVGKFVEK